MFWYILSCSPKPPGEEGREGEEGEAQQVFRISSLIIKGTRCLGLVELVHEKHLKPFVMKSIWVEIFFK